MKNCSIVFLVLVMSGAGCRSLPEPVFAPEQPHLRVVTYNVNWSFAVPQRVIDYLTEVDADVICLQETHEYWEAVLKQEFSKRYQHCVFKKWGGVGGIAIMSKYEIEQVRLIEPNDGWFPALLAEVETPIGRLQFLNVHLKPPFSDEGLVSISALYRTPEVHLKEIQQFVAATDPIKPLIITGDFNEDENGRAIQWLLEEGFGDALSMYDAYSKTWNWPVFGGLKLENRYDHIIFNEYLDCTGACVTYVEASDHMPVMAAIVPKKTK
jgi:endonuclease/exonuclease/phosphatase family metal-dependent hydrolase